MKILIPVLAAMLATAAPAPAQFMTSDPGHSGSYSDQAYMTVRGYLIDTPCAAAHADALSDTAMRHPTACTIHSVDNGLGVVSKGQWYPLDDKGVKKATELLKKSTTDKGMMVQMTGTIRDNHFAVSSIKEIKP